MSDVRAATARAPTTAATVTPMITTATRSSRRLSPRSSPHRPRTSDLHLVEDAVHGRDQCDGDEPDDQAHHDDDGGFEQRGQLVDAVAELALVVAGRRLQLRVQS